MLQKPLTLVLQEFLARTISYKHASAALFLNKPFIDELLVALEDSQWIKAIFSCNVSNRRQRVAVNQHFLKNHRNHSIPELPIYGQVVAPLRIHGLAVTGQELFDGHLATGTRGASSLMAGFCKISTLNSVIKQHRAVIVSVPKSKFPYEVGPRQLQFGIGDPLRESVRVRTQVWRTHFNWRI